ncbi:hypothetical protein H4W80_011416 [Nonomuraea angiospora]|uniref:Uncharacterized protein n=1 Tax=Nonomuraea angiospora TaxID=46172 RepID=A0ABR9MKX9_9ACTN|nr:hypothetical protein [Nonomuraea angiospora]
MNLSRTCRFRLPSFDAFCESRNRMKERQP